MTRLSRCTVAFLLAVSALAVVPGTVGAVSDRPTACGGSWSPSDGVDADAANETIRVVIRFADSASRACIENAVSAVDGRVVGGEGVDIVPMAVAEVPPSAMEALRALPDIRSVERDRTVSAVGFGDAAAVGGERAVGSASGQAVPWGIDRINATLAASAVTDASMRDVQVAVMDSGIDLDHPDLADNLVWGTDHINGNHRDGLNYTDDVYGHGTHVAGTIAARDNGRGVVGVAPNVELYSVRVLNESGIGYYSWWIQAIDRAVEGPDGTVGTADDPEIISMSLGGPVSTPAFEDAVERASDHAILVAAAGNSGDGDPTDNEVSYPAKYPETITVASTDTSDSTATSSAEGSEVDIAAPGVDITSTTDPKHAFGAEYASMSGTSMATPHVSGVAALLIAQDLADGSRDRSDAAVERRLYDSAVDIHGSGEDRFSGHGRLRAAAALGVSVSSPPTASFTLTPTSPFVGQSVTFDASAATDDKGIVAYDWDVGGTSFGTTEPTTERTIRQSGSVRVTLTVTDADGQTDSATRTVTVQSNAAPTAAFTVSPRPLRPGRPITLDAGNSTDDHGIVRYEWTIDGRRITATDPVRTVAAPAPGTHNVTLTVVDGGNRTNSTTRTVTVPLALSLSNASVVSPVRANETTPVRTAVTVADVRPNATANGTLSVTVALNGTATATRNVTVRGGDRTVLSVPVTPTAAGTYTVSIDGTLSVDGSTFAASGTPLRLSVVEDSEPVAPAVAGTVPPGNVDGDLALEDVDGDGNATRADVTAYYEHRRTAAVRDNPARFDFDNDGVAGTVADALALFEEVA